MLQYTIRRIVQLVFIVWAVSVLVFLIVRILPGDPAQMMAGLHATGDQVERLRKSLGLDQPLYVQYAAFVQNALQGNLGFSYRYGRPVTDMIIEVYPLTLRLALAAMSLALLMAIPLGIASALWRDSIIDRATLVLASFSQSMPTFFLGIVLLIVFAVRLRWFPALGYSGWRALVLPAVTLAFGLIAMIIRVTRAGVIESLQADYVRTARSKGLSTSRVIAKHVLPNAVLPLITVVGLQFGYLLGGIVAIELVFNWPGIGFLMVRAVQQRDYPIIQAVIIVVASTFILTNFMVDLLYAVVDPRIRESIK